MEHTQDGQDNRCEICYQAIATESDTCICTGCNNDFHTDCIRTAVKRHSGCPMCKSSDVEIKSVTGEIIYPPSDSFSAGRLLGIILAMIIVVSLVGPIIGNTGGLLLLFGLLIAGSAIVVRMIMQINWD